MKLKLIVASMGLLGLISCPVFADTDTATTTSGSTSATATTASTSSTTSTTAKKHHRHKHRYHHKMKRHHVRHETKAEERREERMEAERISYKGEMPAVEVCSTSLQSIIIDEQTQSLGRAMPNPCNPGWYNRIHVVGGVNVDIGKWGNRNANFEGENYRRFSLNDVYVNVGANINDWTNAFASISYSNTSTSSDGSFHDYGYYGWGMNSWQYNYSNVYDSNKLSLEQAYFTIGNFNVSPFYLQIGKQFQDYGRYQIHPITRSFDQVMTETLDTSGKLGLILNNGFHASVALFDNRLQKFEDNRNNKPLNFAGTIGFDKPGDMFGWGVGIGYINNIIGVNDIAHAVKLFNDEGYHTSISGVALYGDFNTGPFSLNARWTGATSRFNSLDLPEHGWADLTNTWEVMPDARGAKPWAFGIQGGYGFEFWNMSDTLYLGYQQSSQAAGIGLPQNRYVLGANAWVMKNTMVGLEWDHDKDYSTGNGGSGDSDNLVSLRLGVKFD
jgi:hypothetical protein